MWRFYNGFIPVSYPVSYRFHTGFIPWCHLGAQSLFLAFLGCAQPEICSRFGSRLQIASNIKKQSNGTWSKNPLCGLKAEMVGQKELPAAARSLIQFPDNVKYTTDTSCVVEVFRDETWDATTYVHNLQCIASAG